jgi:hypothetical protein
MTRLLVRPVPITDESATGYLLRLAEANGFVALSELDFLASADSAAHGLARVSTMLNGLSLATLRGPVTRFPHLNTSDQGGLEQQFWNGRRPRYCPACLASSPFWRALWDIGLLSACPKHRVGLLDSCGNCQKPLSWKRSHLICCDCGASLATMPSLRASSSCVAVSRYISSMVETASSQDNFVFTQALPFDKISVRDFRKHPAMAPWGVPASDQAVIDAQR